MYAELPKQAELEAASVIADNNQKLPAKREQVDLLQQSFATDRVALEEGAPDLALTICLREDLQECQGGLDRRLKTFRRPRVDTKCRLSAKVGARKKGYEKARDLNMMLAVEWSKPTRELRQHAF